MKVGLALLSVVTGCGLVNVNGKPLGGGTTTSPTPPGAAEPSPSGSGPVAIAAPAQSGAKCGKTGKEFYLRPGQSFAGGRGTTTFEVGDVNGDGFIDVVTGQPAATLLNKRDGSLDVMIESPWPWAALAYEIALGDFNGDGKLDVIGAGDGSEGRFTSMFGNGDGTFQKGVEFQYPGGQIEMATGDFNADGKLDFAATSYPGFLVFLNPGAGKFSPGAPVKAEGVALVSGDFTGDGKLDLATYDKENVYIYAGKVGGQFAPGSPIPIRGKGAMNDGLVTADFNGDGKPDIAALGEDGYNSSISVLLNTGGAFTSTMFEVSDQGEARGLAAGDLNNDGRPDLAVSNRKTVLVYMNDGKGKFGAPMTVGAAWQGGGGVMSGKIAIADFTKTGIGSIALEQGGNGVSNLQIVLFQGACQ